jgi:hypothetical protein
MKVSYVEGIVAPGPAGPLPVLQGAHGGPAVPFSSSGWATCGERPCVVAARSDHPPWRRQRAMCRHIFVINIFSCALGVFTQGGSRMW